MEMNLYNRCNHHDNKLAAFRMTRALGMTYVKDLDENRIDAEDMKGNVFVATDADNNKQVIAVNLYPMSFLNGKFKWCKYYQGLSMPDGLFEKKPNITMFAQIDGNDELVAFAPRENFYNKSVLLNNVKSRIAKEFYVMNTITREMWHVDVRKGIYEVI